MRVFYTFTRRSGAPAVYRQGAVEFCCEEMCRRWGGTLGFGIRDVAASTSRDVSLFVSRVQASGRPVLEIVPVAFCPWCGQAVETCIIK